MCRAYLTPYWDENGVERYIGRFNLGCISLALPRYAIMANGDKEEFFRIIDKYFDYAMEVHMITYEKMRNTKAKTNPLMFVEGGCLVKLDPEDTIEKALESCTYSIGYIGLEEVSYLLTGKHLHEDNSFAEEVLRYLNAKIDKAKKETGKLIALYAPPSEGICHKMADADREIFGVIEGVTDKEYYENSYHVGSRFLIPALDKQEIENPLFHLSNGGHITYCEYPMIDNFEAYKAIIDNHVRLGQYCGVNVLVSDCNECGASGDFKDVCSECGSPDITTISRCCGYLGYHKQNGDTRYNKGKHAEVDARIRHFGIVKNN